ncbi:MAG: hypothetical protein A3F67_03365 [Verrucomicrobia bacterium RIFCSPHIGHO2_12_FULL_41_10]|nr:MAG: hypothetical protein A3F67_03365 [Verrucomicrobia bacterium RIFCSPHIGHO2_12_FULL_41_10]HLB34847.1 type II toxin-antitoxin system prevent-host-death family antitoxin [Chthoniobacterales bacterium]
MVANLSISIKELHAKTGAQVRRVNKSRSPITVTDRGKPIAVLIAPNFIAANPRHRTLLPEYAKLLSRSLSNDVLDDLDAIRGDR